MNHEQHPDDYYADRETTCTECRIPMLPSERVNPAHESEAYCVFCWPTIQERDAAEAKRIAEEEAEQAAAPEPADPGRTERIENVPMSEMVWSGR